MKRLLRLSTAKRNLLIERFYSEAVKSTTTIKNIRNIGIIAHIDAGKTTVTERLLYLTGSTKVVGDVDDGNTVTDFMDLERERGITIQSAAVSSFWRNHRINLIDTPGHVDFTVEVERCLRVLDGAVTVLDGSAGVQAQTLTVWKQAQKFRLPIVFFVNKMDKPASNFQMSLDSIENRLDQRACATSVPVYNDSKLVGFVDLLSKSFLDITNQRSKWIPIAQNAPYSDELLLGREELFSRIAEVDDKFAEALFATSDYYNFPIQQVISTLRRCTLDRSLAPVGCGTALRHAMSVQPVLDSVVDFLPSPLEKDYHLPDGEFCGLVFKIVHDKRKGQLSYMRVYKGELHHGASVLNLNRQCIESGVKLFTPFSDDFQPSDKVTEGNIAVMSGLGSTITGDTLVGTKETAKSKNSSKAIREEDAHVNLLAGIELPDPVFYCAIEPPSTGSIHAFERALKELAVEDPSLKVRTDAETGQTILEGMGELHIEVMKERLNREYGLNVFVGPLQVGYREVINEPVTHTASVEDTLGEQKFKQSCSITLDLEPTVKDVKFAKVAIQLEDSESGNSFVRAEWAKAISEGCKNALFNGPVLGYPVHNVKITLKGLHASGGKLNPALLSACASTCVTEALTRSGAHLIEPVMSVEVTVVDDATRHGVHGILQELNRRRATVKDVAQQDTRGQSIVIEARVPLSETAGMATAIRSITSGMAGLHMQFLEYEHVSPHDQAAIVDRRYHRA